MRSRIQFVSRTLPHDGEHGAATYALDLFRYLARMGFQIEYTLLGSPPLDFVGHYNVPQNVSRLIRLSAAGHAGWGRALFPQPRSSLGWVASILGLTYPQLPAPLRALHRLLKPERETTLASPGSTTPEVRPAFDDFPTTGEMAFFRAEYQRLRPAVVVADYAWMAPILDEVRHDEGTLRVVLTYDVLYQRIAEFDRCGVDSGHRRWTMEAESALLRKAQLLIAIQDEDARLLKAMAPEQEVLAAPFAARPRRSTRPAQPGRCLIVASRGLHNVYSVQWFLEEVWPRVRERYSTASLHVCGTVCEALTGEFPGVCLLGRVEDLAPEYGEAQACLAPLLMGSGLKIKLVEALAYGRAIVATSVSLQGIRLASGTAALVADSAPDFAVAIGRVLAEPDLRRQLEAGARAFAAANLTPKSCYQPLVDRLRAHSG